MGWLHCTNRTHRFCLPGSEADSPMLFDYSRVCLHTSHLHLFSSKAIPPNTGGSLIEQIVETDYHSRICCQIWCRGLQFDCLFYVTVLPVVTLRETTVLLGKNSFLIFYMQQLSGRLGRPWILSICRQPLFAAVRWVSLILNTKVICRFRLIVCER